MLAFTKIKSGASGQPQDIHGHTHKYTHTVYVWKHAYYTHIQTHTSHDF